LGTRLDTGLPGAIPSFNVVVTGGSEKVKKEKLRILSLNREKNRNKRTAKKL